MEFFSSLYDPSAYRRAVKGLKGLQDCLGEFQDGEVTGGDARVREQMFARRPAGPGGGTLPPTAADSPSRC